MEMMHEEQQSLCSFSRSEQAINAAHVEVVNGTGLVILMSRSTGHITLHATLSSWLLLEIDFHVEGKGDLIEFLYMQG
ncbi:hypothetical protein CFC21_057196 [Triticum aestivum]|uniref:Uncharacterized protein n=3 Tax=Triticum TaxID=4564 RepID=A0A9R0T0M2_TRITD|nr:hypothetical protein CFC21_057196 [Triticum aestivum]VAI03893.1 unnamed protein product [Triticum turgidum subsp. durum]